MLPPPITPLPDLAAALRERGYAVLSAAGICELASVDAADLDAWRPCWNRLPPDGHLRDGGHYRRRRHSSFVVDAGAGDETFGVRLVPHRAHWQSIDYNALHGGIERWFEPMEPAMSGSIAWRRLLAALGGVAGALRRPQRWFVEAHPFRIDTEGGIGRPTPEGAHRDGVDLVVVMLVERRGVKGGETRVFDAAGPNGVRFTLDEPGSALLLDDARMVHETTPIQPDPPGAAGHRDTLVLTFRAGGFQEPLPAGEQAMAQEKPASARALPSGA